MRSTGRSAACRRRSATQHQQNGGYQHKGEAQQHQHNKVLPINGSAGAAILRIRREWSMTCPGGLVPASHLSSSAATAESGAPRVVGSLEAAGLELVEIGRAHV